MLHEWINRMKWMKSGRSMKGDEKRRREEEGRENVKSSCRSQLSEYYIRFRSAYNENQR